MRKKSLLALLLVLSLVMSGCALITVDQAADNAQIIVDVNGETVTKGQVLSQVNNAISQNEYMNQIYAMFGMTANYPTDAATLTPQVIQSYVENLVTVQKAKELGMDKMTEEEQAHIAEHAQENWNSYLSQIASNFFPDKNLEGEELEKEAQKYIEERGLATKDDFTQSATNEVMLEKLEADAVKDVTVSAEEIAAHYDEKVAADREAYTADANAYGSAVNGGSAVYYAPAGYRMVKHILVKLQEADETAIDEKKTAQTDAEAALKAAQAALETPAEGADTAALQTAVEEAQKALDAANAAVNEATEAAFANVKEKADEVYAKATAEGADFDALVKEYSEDSMPETGYAITQGFTDFVEPFTTAAMALEKAGDVTEPVRSDYGYHIIQYVSDVQEGPIELDSVKEAIESELLAEKKEAVYAQAVADWTAAAQVKTYPEKMK